MSKWNKMIWQISRFVSFSSRPIDIVSIFILKNGIFIARAFRLEMDQMSVQIAQLPQKLYSMFRTMIYHHSQSRGRKRWREINFGSLFFAFAFPFALKKFSPKSTDTTQHNTQHKEKKSPFSVINSIFNLVCILSYLLAKASKKIPKTNRLFTHTQDLYLIFNGTLSDGIELHKRRKKRRHKTFETIFIFAIWCAPSPCLIYLSARLSLLSSDWAILMSLCLSFLRCVF